MFLGIANAISGIKSGGLSFIKDNLKLYLDFKSSRSDTLAFPSEGSTSFNGTDNYISTNADSTLTDATYTFWAKADVTGVNTGVFGHGGLSQGAFHFNQSSNQPLLYMGSNRFRYWNDNSAQDDNQWHHWAIILDADDMTGCKLYIDGVEQTASTTGNSGDFNAYTTGLEIGRADSSNEFEGKLANFAVWSRFLSPEEVQSIMNKSYSQLGSVEKTSLVAWWALDDIFLGKTTNVANIVTSTYIVAKIIENKASSIRTRTLCTI